MIHWFISDIANKDPSCNFYTSQFINYNGLLDNISLFAGCHILGAFLIPYFICLLVCGIPLVALEFSIGQYWQKGPTMVFMNLCPLLSG